MSWKMALFFFSRSSLWADINIYYMTSVSAHCRYSRMSDFHFFPQLTSVLKFISYREVQLLPTESSFSPSSPSSSCQKSNVIIQCIKPWLQEPFSFWLADFHLERKISNAFWFFTPWNFSSPWAMVLEPPLCISDHIFYSSLHFVYLKGVIHIQVFCCFFYNQNFHIYLNYTH